MADDILQEKLFNFLCGSGGFVDLSVLLRRSSPLGSRKSANEAVIWLENQRTFALVKDGKGKVLGVRVDFKKKLCQQYISTGYCRKKEGFCKHWHICKKFIEGKCDSYFGCELSHNFHEGANSKMLQELCLVKYSNRALRNIVAWSLPQVCQWYLRGECSSYKCSYVHICVKAIQGFSCGCSLSHSLDDTRHNLFVLKQYDLVPSNKVLNAAFVRCSVLFLGKDRPFVKQENASLGNNGLKNQSEEDFAPSEDDFSTPENASLGTNGLENSAWEEDFSPSKDHFSSPENASLGTNGLENPEEDFVASEDDISTPENASLGTNGLKNPEEDVVASEDDFSTPENASLGTNGLENPEEDFAASEDDFSTPENASLGTNGLKNPEEDFVASEDDFSTPKNASLGTNGLENPEEDFVASEDDFSTPVVATDIQTQNTGMTITSPVTGKSETENKLSQNDMTKDSAATYAANIFPSSRFRDAGASDNLFRRLCKEFKCSVPLSVLHDKKVVLPSELNDFMNILQENRDKFLVIRNVQGVIHQISAFCPKLRLCSNYVSAVNECKTENCPYFHLCKDFIKGCCIYGENCSQGHSFQNKRDRNTLLQLKLDGFTNGQLRQLLLASSPQVCIDYNGGTCMLGPLCSRVHICKEFVMNTCSREGRCLLDHNRAFETKHTILLLQKFKLGSIPCEKQLKAIFACGGEDHGRSTKGEAWSDSIDVTINTSRDNLIEAMRESETGVTRKTSETKAVDENSAEPKTNRMAALTSPRNDSVSPENTNEPSLNGKQSATGVTTQTLTWKNVGANSTEPKANRMDVTSPRSYSVVPESKNEVTLNMKRSESSTGINCFPDKWHVFQCLCTEYDCSTSFTAIGSRTDLFPHGIESARSWFRRTEGSFLVTDSDTTEGEISRVEAFSSDLRLCLSWIERQTCHQCDCQYFHVCKSYITDSCTRGTSCPMNHNFHTKKDQALLSKVRLDLLTEQQLRKLALQSSPQVCEEYNNSICTSGSSCLKIHICNGYLRKNCKGTWRCGLEHESAFSTKQTKAVLQRLRFNSINTPDLLKLILESRRCLSSQDKTNRHIHVDEPNVPICSSFLVGDCAKGIRCLNHHCALPYHWQYKVPNVDAWNSFSDEDNATLERLYCDINVETRMKFKPVEPLDFSLAERGVVSLVQGYTITIDLDDMIMFLAPLKSQGSVISQLRRLSTEEGAVDPCGTMSMSWTWYWEENDHTWRTYDKDRSGRDLQHLVEQAYQDYLKQGQVREKFGFATAEQEYDLFFYPSGMHQVNLKTAKKRRVRRRPGKVISKENIEDLKWQYGDPSVKEEVRRQLRAENKYFLSHWSSMPPNASYYCTSVDPLEFKKLEQLFRRTMKDYAKIIAINGVQNLGLMEKYCRKKEKMLAAAAGNHQQVNEKRLFHGTSSDAVEAICKHNFSWCLHGKNTTNYGEGSYFARDASYSHAFAEKNAFGYHEMFVAKVLVGSYTKGHSSYRRPPPKIPSDPVSDLYDSCVDDQSDPSIFVIFDTDQLYPEYIVKYSTVSHPASSSTYHSLPNPSISQSRALPRASVTVAREPPKPSSSQTQALTEANVTTTCVGPNPSSTLKQVPPQTSVTATRGNPKSASFLTELVFRVMTPGQSPPPSANASQSCDPRHHSLKASVGGEASANTTQQSTSLSASGYSSSEAHTSSTEYSTSELPGLEKKKEKCLVS
ncbi:uncharacterized protein [Montipora foliosa]|uniref:uncharacterized protein n=1 Tax=Montipora foliosa TaxID=591990 RepID=UPI0035F202B1